MEEVDRAGAVVEEAGAEVTIPEKTDTEEGGAEDAAPVYVTAAEVLFVPRDRDLSLDVCLLMDEL